MMNNGSEWVSGTLLEKVPVNSHKQGIRVYLITYVSDGLKVNGYLAVPESALPCPSLIFCRGGIGKVGMPRKRRILSMAQRGYVVFAPFYRGSKGSEGRDEFGGGDRNDIGHAITLLQSLPEVKPGPVPLIGFSRGGFMALLAAKHYRGAGPVVFWGGVSDLFATYEERIDLRRMLKRVVGNPRKEPDAYRSRSPVHWIQDIHVPVLIIHGIEDALVSVSHAWKLAEGLKQAGKPYTMELYEGLGHRFPRAADEMALDLIFAWIAQNMSG